MIKKKDLILSVGSDNYLEISFVIAKKEEIN